MISNTIQVDMQRSFAMAEAEADPERKAARYLEAIELAEAAIEDESDLSTLARIANVRRSNCRVLANSLQNMRSMPFSAWSAYCDVIGKFREELIEEALENQDVRRALNHFFALQLPLNLVPKATQLMLREIW